jgi:hypothetical protein
MTDRKKVIFFIKVQNTSNNTRNNTIKKTTGQIKKQKIVITETERETEKGHVDQGNGLNGEPRGNEKMGSNVL